jgi:hypothetical protein
MKRFLRGTLLSALDAVAPWSWMTSMQDPRCRTTRVRRIDEPGACLRRARTRPKMPTPAMSSADARPAGRAWAA